MTARGKRTRLVAIALCLVMIIGSAMPVFAAAPAKEKIEYEGKGLVEVEFYGKVAWKNPVVTVKDASGKTYKATIVKKDGDDITFKINGYKEGTKYNFTISGARKKGTKGYGKISGTVAIPKAKTVAKKPAPKKAAAKTPAKVTYIASATAKNTAINAAVKNLGAQKASLKKFEVEKDTFRGKVVWEVSFEGKRSGKTGWFEFEYVIDATTGKILRTEVERD